MYQPPTEGWDKRKLRWVGISLSPEESRAYTETAWAVQRQMPRPFKTERLTDGVVVSTYQLPVFGVVHLFTKFSPPLVIGFGIRVNDIADGRVLLGKANRVLGSLGIDQEAGVFEKWLGTTAEAMGEMRT